MSQGNLPATLDASALKNRVQEHVTNTFGMLIPDEQFKATVDGAIKEFFELPRELAYEEGRIGYSDRYETKLKTKITPFQQMVWMILVPIVRKRLDEYMAEGGGNPVDKFITDFFGQKGFEDQQIMSMQRLMIAMCASMFESAGKQQLMDFRFALGNSLSNQGMPEIATAVWNTPTPP